MDTPAGPRLYQGMFVWDPIEGGTLYAVAKINVRGARAKAILVQHNGHMGTKLIMKHDRLPKGWYIIDPTELAYLIGLYPSLVKVDG